MSIDQHLNRGNAIKNKLWVEKYRPHTLDDYIFYNDKIENKITEYVTEDKIIPHMILSGVQGTGKTSLAYCILNDLGIDIDNDVLILDASMKNKVEFFRDDILSFISTFAMGDYKVVLLEEADLMTPAAQSVLRGMMEDHAHVARFILTCNYLNKIIPAIQSRNQIFKFHKQRVPEVTEFVAKILIAEKVKFSLDDLDAYVTVAYPDIRQTIQLIQQNCLKGHLLTMDGETGIDDYKMDLLKMITTDNWTGARKIVCSNVSDGEWESVYSFLYQNLHRSTKFADQEKWENGIVIVAEYLYKNATVSDQEINAAAMFIQLTQL